MGESKIKLRKHPIVNPKWLKAFNMICKNKIATKAATNKNKKRIHLNKSVFRTQILTIFKQMILKNKKTIGLLRWARINSQLPTFFFKTTNIWINIPRRSHHRLFAVDLYAICYISPNRTCYSRTLNLQHIIQGFTNNGFFFFDK